MSTTMYHYAACFYSERNLAFMIDPGRNNVRRDDGTQDEFGQRFKYKYVCSDLDLFSKFLTLQMPLHRV